MDTAATTAIVRRVLGPDGQPASTHSQEVRAALPMDMWERQAVVRHFASFMSALYSIQAEPLNRTLDPYVSHAWVYAAVTAIARNVSQTVLRIYREDKATQDRRIQESRSKRCVSHRAGDGRTARTRYLMQKGRRKAAPITGVEIDFDHPLNSVLNRPNYLMTGTMLWSATAIFQYLKGSCIWTLWGPDDTNYVPGEVPAEIWPMPPELFQPLYEDNRIVAWNFNVPQGCGRGYGGRSVTLSPHEVVNFRHTNPNPNFFHRGFSPATPVGNQVYLDQLSTEHNKATLLNGADPGGILMSPHEFESETERLELQEDWERRYKGVKNARKVAVLGGGLEYISTGHSNKDMMYKDMRMMNRDEVLAAFGVTKSALGVTDDLNYATQRSQDKNFWDKTLIPLLRSWEDEIDNTLLYTEPDNVFAAFDLTEVESLREGMGDAITNARALASIELHMPPRYALEVVGIDAPHYEGEMEVATTPQAAQEARPDPEEKPEKPGEKPDEGTITDEENKRPRADRTSQRADTRAVSPWKEHTREVQQPAEKDFKRSFKEYVLEDLAATLERFDAYAQQNRLSSISLVKVLNPDDVILPLLESQRRLGKKVRPAYRDAAQAEIEFVGPQFGDVLDIDVDDEIIAEALDERENVLLGWTPPTIQRRLRRSLRQGVERGEDISELRERIERVYRRHIKPSQSLLIARTESSGFINAVRQRIFEYAGIKKAKWVTAADEKVRDTHVIYGRSKARELGFNYMTLSGTQDKGSLAYPGDVSAPIEEVGMCRCILIPVK